MAELSEKQKRFVLEYLIDLNATQAAIRAGYSEKTAQEQGSRLLSNVMVSEAISKGQAKAAKRAEITVQSLADELEEARAIALAEKQSSAAVSATMGKAKLFGLGSENRRVTGTIQVVQVTAKQLEALSDDELATLETAYPVLQKLGLVGSDSLAAADTGSAEES